MYEKLEYRPEVNKKWLKYQRLEKIASYDEMCKAMAEQDIDTEDFMHYLNNFNNWWNTTTV